jgi:hypothetical protein
MSLKRILVLSLLITLSGCQYVKVQSLQMNGLISAFYSGSDSDSGSLPAAGWAVQYGGVTATVQALAADELTAFINDRDAILFDGWTITKVIGLKSFRPAWEIEDLGRERTFNVNGQVVAVHRCDPWVEIASDDGVRFEQQCMATSAYTNMILVNMLGQITHIEQVVDSSLMVLSLRLEN